MPTPTGATDISGASKRISSLLNPEPELEPTEEAIDEEQDVPQIEVESAEVEEQSDEDGQPEPEVIMHRVKVDGEELEVAEDELRAGYMKNSDYQNKTKSLSKQRKALEDKEAAIDRQLEEAAALVEIDLQNLESDEMKELKEDDPDAYLKEFEKAQKKVTKFNALKEKRTVEQQARHQKIVAKELEALEIAIPEWLDPEIKAKEGNAIFSRWKEMGMTDQDISQVVDHTRFVDARKALLFDQMMSQDLESKKVKTPPKTVKPGTTKTPEAREDDAIKNLRGKLKKSGSVKDAANLFKQLVR
jgi:hypothetical protein